jgi:uncharacterized protein YndB with AHSA1/START domain
MKFEKSVLIQRSVEDVFDFMWDFNNWSKWHGGMLEAEQSSEGPVGVGTTYRGVKEFLYRRVEWTSEVTAYEPNRKFCQRLESGPMSIEEIISFEPAEGGTKLTIGGEGETGGLFKLAEGMMQRRMEKEMETNLAGLKDLLEAQG